MAYFEDLQPCTAFPGQWKGLVAVGWLAKGHDFPRGPVNRELITRLDGAGAWQPPDAPSGSHRCDLCPEGEVARTGSGAIFIPGDGVLYVAPRLITHYMRKHGYAPPAAFCRAAAASPAMRSVEYFDAISAHFTGLVPVRRPAAPGRYDLSDIVVLEGLEPIRLRPGMYLGATNSAALDRMLEEVVENSVKDYLVGGARRVTVEVDGKGWVTVEDDGRGIPVDPMPGYGLSALEIIFTRLLTPGPSFGGQPAPNVNITRGMFGVGLPVVNALSARLEVESRRAGVAYTAAFEAGKTVEPLSRGGETALKGTRIRYLPDDEIFDEGSRLDLTRLENRFIELARLCPRPDLRVQGRSLQRAEGLPGWVRELAPDAVTETALSAFGTVDEVEVELALAWSPSGTAPRVLSFVNYASLTDGGSQEEGLLAAVRASAPDEASGNRLLAGLVAVVHVGMLHPRFRGPIRAALEVDAARTAVIEVVRRAVAEAPWWWDRLHERIK